MMTQYKYLLARSVIEIGQGKEAMELLQDALRLLGEEMTSSVFQVAKGVVIIWLHENMCGGFISSIGTDQRKEAELKVN